MPAIRLILPVLLLLSSIASALEVPAALEPWRDWVLRDLKDRDCLQVQNQAVRHCVWASSSTITLAGDEVRFAYEVTVYQSGLLVIPGDAAAWPTQVSVDGKPLAVADQNGVPVVRLEQGQYRLQGRIPVAESEATLVVPDYLVLIDFVREGQSVPPRRDARGRLQLRDRAEASPSNLAAQDSASIEVYRKITDDIPLQLVTHLQVNISGKAREMILGRVSLPDTELVALTAPFPVRVEADGTLRAQVRPGRWVIEIRARFLAFPETLTAPQNQSPWPNVEHWFFELRPKLRSVRIMDGEAVDPSRLQAPPDWSSFPAFQMTAGETLTLVEQSRGDINPPQNQLALERDLWLDFDGQGATVRDRITGSMSQGWRLEAGPGLQLGRVAINGEPQLVTTLDGQTAGVEIRNPALSLEALSRLDGSPERFQASGWQGTFDQLTMRVHLPPGWKLWTVDGPDYASDTWLAAWDLWDIFLCLLAVVVATRVLGKVWGGLLLLALLNGYHEGAPFGLWLTLLIVLPLIQALPANWASKSLSTLSLLGLLTLTLQVLDFAITSVREGLYPQLEYNRHITTEWGYAREMAPAFEQADVASAPEAARALQSFEGDGYASAPTPKAPPRLTAQPAEITQTGPGQPQWQWNQAQLNWSGAVSPTDSVALYFSPPWMTRLINVLNAVLFGLLVAGLASRLIAQCRLKLMAPPTPEDSAGYPRAMAGEAAGSSSLPGSSVSVLVIALGLGLLSTLAPPRALAETSIPAPELLKQYREFLLEQAHCETCLAVNEVDLAVDEKTVRLALRVTALRPVALQLPQIRGDFDLVSVSLTPESRFLSARESSTLAPLSEGQNDLVLVGRIRGDAFQIDFPFPARNPAVRAQGWQLEGLSRGQIQNNSLRFVREQVASATEVLTPNAILPFVQVARTLTLDRQWTVQTTVRKIAPANEAASVSIPLLPGERVLSDLEVRDERVQLQFSGSTQQLQWSSTLEPVPEIALTQTAGTAVAEQWILQPSEKWHLQTRGVVNVRLDEAATPFHWFPMPGETLTVSAVRPDGVEGATTTVQGVSWKIEPGGRVTRATLTLDLTSSIAVDYPVVSPTNAQLLSIVLNGEQRILPDRSDWLQLPLNPGTQQAVLTWEIPGSVPVQSTTPALYLGSPLHNIDVEYVLPENRWPLILSGPPIGPAMLFWGVLIVMLLVSAGLGMLIRRYRLSVPVRTWQWVLLSLGISTTHAVTGLLVVIWFFAMEWRRVKAIPAVRWRHNLLQLALVGLTLMAGASLVSTVPQSLLGSPDMQIVGNGSDSLVYRWYQDRQSGNDVTLTELGLEGNTESRFTPLPEANVISVPLWVYRLTMLAWSLWLAFALLQWVRWGWDCFAAGKLWLPAVKKEPTGAAR